MDLHAFEISFPLEYQPPLWRLKPANFLSHFVGHEGPGSLYSYLKNRGWVIALSAGNQDLARAFATFKITVHLTEEGFSMHFVLRKNIILTAFLENYRSIILVVFKYLNLLRASNLEEYHQKEVADLSAIRFQFSEKKRADSYVTWIAEHMSWPVPPEHLLTSPQCIREWAADGNVGLGQSTIRKYLDSFRIQEGRVVLMAKEHEKLNPGSNWEKETWYGTEYNVERFDEEFIKKVNNLHMLQGTLLTTFSRQMPLMIFRSCSYPVRTHSCPPTWMLTNVRSRRYQISMIMIFRITNKYLYSHRNDLIWFDRHR